MSALAYTGGDLSLRRDITSLVTLTVERARRPEARDHLAVRSILTWDPKAAPSGEVDFAEVRAALERLPIRFPGLQLVRVDAAAESSSVLPWCRQHPRLSLLVQPFTATADTNMQIWSALVARLHARTISIPRHERLLGELRGLRAESFSFGSKWRVVDSSRQFHRDVSFSLALAVHAAGSARVCQSPLCDDPACDGHAPMSLLFSPESRAWDATHPSAEALALRASVEGELNAKDAAAVELPQEEPMSVLAAARRGLVDRMLGRTAMQAQAAPPSREEKDAALWHRVDAVRRSQAEERREREAADSRARSAAAIRRSVAARGWWWPGE
jgi:hypothetical protein